MKKTLLTIAVAVAAIATPSLANADSANHTEEQKQNEALVVINGNHRNGEDRKVSLKANGFDYDEIQNIVNQIIWGTTDESVNNVPVQTETTQPVQEQSAPAEETQPAAETTAQPEVTQPAPATTAGLDLNTTSGSVDITALANYMASAHPVMSAGQWANVISRESGGSLTATNASSEAYGVFQLLGHGEYPGMTLGQQIAMASTLPASAWAETLY
ncbi:transglycosylase (endogenous virus) [Lactococcus phage KSY1]|uniref:Gp074 n=1 Tax=Lactococcus phage KSY1 TaxID=2913972 RepID=A6MAD9_9CAUD|nr:transglycosylase [Lactococcus phage KSY1]ABG21617.1 gp074 [Lactococcus phage KSY1]